MNVLRKSHGRVFIKTQPGVYNFVNSMGVGSLDRSLGEVSAIEIPSETNYDEFVEIASTSSADSRWSSSLTSFLPRDSYSPLEELARSKCEFSMQIHYGECSKPNNFSSFDSAIVLNNVKLTNYSLTDLIARTPDQRGIVEESANISASSMYRILPQKFVETAQSTFNNLVLSTVVYVKESSCLNLNSSCSAGCGFYVSAFVDSSTGNKGFVYTTNGGLTWIKQSVNGITFDTGSIDGTLFYLHFDGTNLILVVEVKVSGVLKTLIYSMPIASLGVSGASAVKVIDRNTITVRNSVMGSRYIFLSAGAANAEVWSFDLSTNTLVRLHQDTKIIGATPYLAVKDDDNVIAFNRVSGYIKSNTYGLFTGHAFPVSGTDSRGVYWLKDGTIIFTTAIGVYISHNNGHTWKLVSVLPSTARNSIRFFDELTGYLSNHLGIYRTIDGGYTWTLVYDLSSSSIGRNRHIAICPSNPNLVVGIASQYYVGNTQTAAIIGK